MKEKTFIKINNIKLTPDKGTLDIKKYIYRQLRLDKSAKIDYEIIKKSIDARHKPNIVFTYSVGVYEIHINGKKINLADCIKKCKNRDVLLAKRVIYEFPAIVKPEFNERKRPVIIGFGPAGMFAALKLSEAGLRPVVYERGDSVDIRTQKVHDFWNGGVLCESSNVQFGEGGAGTFSDGKLNTQISDTYGRIRDVLETFVRFGAAPEITYVNKPHIGTDVLAVIVKNIRKYIISLGAEVNFNTRLDGIITENGKISSIRLVKNDKDGKEYEFERECESVCLAIGHSARDTFEMINSLGIAMEPKPFAVGVRIEHPQDYINDNAYGNAAYDLPAADYKVACKSEASGTPRGVYSFCMCPGGYVVNASSENGRIAVNGMSYSGRNSANANSALIVTVGPDDYGSNIMDGIHFQRRLEEAAYNEGGGNVPVQLFADFENNRLSGGFGRIVPCIKGEYTFGNLRNILPDYVADSLIDGIHSISRLIKGYDMEDAVLSGVESRTSSPLRIIRNENLYSINLKGLYPCGEGAGYAGGITSAAVDGIKVAESIVYNMDFL